MNSEKVHTVTVVQFVIPEIKQTTAIEEGKRNLSSVKDLILAL